MVEISRNLSQNIVPKPVYLRQKQ